MKVVPYTEADEEEWDAFVEHSHNGTFLHTRRFLSYHGTRFADASMCIFDGKGRLVGLLPAAADDHDRTEVVSHPGITYGGLIHGGRLQGEDVIDAFREILRNYRERAFRTFLYKAIPTIYQVIPAEEDAYAFFRLQAERVRCDLSAAVDLERRPESPRSLIRRLGKAQRLGLRIDKDPDQLARFWVVLQSNLARHGATPVHTIDEMSELMRRFPDSITLVTAALGDELLAGSLLFTTTQTVHAQYRASSARGRTMGAQDLVDETCIIDSITSGKRFFSFGISTEQDGPGLNVGLHRYKAKFGAGGVVHEFYRCQLDRGEF